MSFSIEEHWYRSSMTWLTRILLPFSWLFRVIVFVRKSFYSWRKKSLAQFSVPIIVVGNVTVGGTGKTPFVIALAEKLKTNGERPGIVSRGAGGKHMCVPCKVTATSDPLDVGDEAVLLSKRTACPVYVCVDRVAAVKQLLAENNCTIVISDDGLQHYRLKRNSEIAMIDGERGIGNGQLLPAGPLREPVSRLASVDMVISQGISPLAQYQMRLEAADCLAVNDEAVQKILQDFAGKKVNAVAAIGHPQRFFSMLRQYGINVIEHPFPDHYLFQSSDFCFENDWPILMTEKDAVKCQSFADARFWFVPVTAKIEDACWSRLMSFALNSKE